jgi:hypothetical protein
VLIVRLLLGLVFFVFGLNAFLQFLKGPIPGGLAGQFLQALSSRTMGWRSAQCRRLAARLDLYRKGFVCIVTANACGFARTSAADRCPSRAINAVPTISRKIEPR